MGAIDGLSGGKVDPHYDWTTFGDDYWESLGPDDQDLAHYYEKGSCWQQEGGGVWWIHKYGKPAESFVYLICFSSEGSDRIIVPTIRTLSDPDRRLLEPPQFKQMIERPHYKDVQEQREFGISLSRFEDAFDHVKLWGSAHAHWNPPPYVLYAFSIMNGAEIAPFDKDRRSVLPKIAPEKRGWLKRIFGGQPKEETLLDQFDSTASTLIIKSYRNFAARASCAPTAKTPDAQIIDIYKRIGSAFRQVASERREHLNADSINSIVLKFIQISEGFGSEMLEQHLAYELQKYRTEGLRSEYEKGVQLF